jgi:hypothetical protein
MLNFTNIITSMSDIYRQSDWLEWRYCYEGGAAFREEYLEEFSDREDPEDFIRRRSLTPIPTFAKKEVNLVKNSVSQRFPDISRRGGSKLWRDAVTGVGLGVDRRGSSMNSYLTKYIMPEMLPMQQVGVLVDAPKVEGPSAADVPIGFRPYLSSYRVEDFRVYPAPTESPSDWAAVILRETLYHFEKENGETTESTQFRYLWLDENRGNLVTSQKLNEQGQPTEDPVFTNLVAIPFVVFDMLDSLIRDVCSYQIVCLNMISADSNYAIDSNYSFLTRQRGMDNAGAHLIGADEGADTGTRKGLFYDKNSDRPQFISPPTGPMKGSLELRREMKEEVHELVTGVLADLGGDNSIEAGLAFIGSCLETSERRLWDHWTAYESADPRRRNVPQIDYPDTWSLKSDEERVKEANALVDLSQKLVGQEGRKEVIKLAVNKLFVGKLKTKDLDRLHAEIDAADWTTSDPDVVIKAKQFGLVGAETGTQALGFPKEEAERAKKDQADRAAQIVQAQADAKDGAARGAEDLSEDPESNKLAREGEADTSAKLGGDQDPGTRGESN